MKNENETDKNIGIKCMLYSNVDPRRAYIMQEFIQGLDELVAEAENLRFAKLYTKCDDYFKEIVDGLREEGKSYSEVLSIVNEVRYSIIEKGANKLLDLIKVDSNIGITNHQEELFNDIKKTLLSRNGTVKNIRFRLLTKKIKKYNKY